MPHVLAYHRPTSLEDALALLARPAATTRVLAGGTIVNADPRAAPVEVVDLQALGLESIHAADGGATIGATATLQDIADHDGLPEVLRILARRELPSAMRTLATIGGTIAMREWESPLIAALLAFEASVTVAALASAEAEVPLAEILDRGVPIGGLIVGVQIRTGGRAAVAHTARTPADTPIVAVVARRMPDGTARIGASGVATTAILVEPQSIDRLDPPGDFRGTPGYRRHLAAVLVGRALAELVGAGTDATKAAS